jgi:hypothetical protein
MGIMEDILEELQGIRAALEGGAAPTPAEKPAPAKDKPATAKGGKSKVKEAEITELMQGLVKDPEQKGKVKDLLAAMGVARFGELDSGQWQGFYDGLVAIRDETGGEDAGDDEDELL